MRKAFGLRGASLFLAGPALAADLAIKAPVYKALPMVVPTLGWSADNAVTNTGTDTGGGGLGAALAGNAIPGLPPSSTAGFWRAVSSATTGGSAPGSTALKRILTGLAPMAAPQRSTLPRHWCRSPPDILVNSTG